MKVHETAIFQLSPEYAYGDLGMPPAIPPGSTVYFELELISIEGDYWNLLCYIFLRIMLKCSEYFPLIVLIM